MKIAIIGMGRVGATLAYSIVMRGLCDHLMLCNRTASTAAGDAMDLQHSLAFCQHSMKISSGEIAEAKNVDVVVITASIPMSKTMTSRTELGLVNVALFRELVPLIASNNPDAVLVIVSNPVDALTYLTTKLSGFPASRVIGVSTLIDSATSLNLVQQKTVIKPSYKMVYNAPA